MVAILAEPTLIVVFVGITLLAKAMLPFVVNHLLVGNPAVYWSPAHLFLIAAFFTLLIVETDRLPIHSSTHIEVYMIDATVADVAYFGNGFGEANQRQGGSHRL